MMTRTLLRLAALSALLVPSLAQAESIASINDSTRDYTLEGDVVTVWENSFLFNDGSGQIVVDIRPLTTREAGIKGRDYVQVTGHEATPGILTALVLQEANREPVLLQGTSTLPPLPLNEVMRNTIRYRIAERRNIPAAVAAAPVARTRATPAAQAPAAVPSVDEAVRSAIAEHAAGVRAAGGVAPGDAYGQQPGEVTRTPNQPAPTYGTPSDPVQPVQ